MSKVTSLQGLRFSNRRIPQASKINRNKKSKSLIVHKVHTYKHDKVEPVKDCYNRGYEVKIGEVLLARFRGQDSTNLGVRPCVVIHRGGTDNILEVVPLTRSKPKYSHHIIILDKVLKRPSTVLCDNVHTIDKTQVIESWGRIDKDNFQKIIKIRRRVMTESLKEY